MFVIDNLRIIVDISRSQASITKDLDDCPFSLLVLQLRPSCLFFIRKFEFRSIEIRSPIAKALDRAQHVDDIITSQQKVHVISHHPRLLPDR